MIVQNAQRFHEICLSSLHFFIIPIRRENMFCLNKGFRILNNLFPPREWKRTLAWFPKSGKPRNMQEAVFRSRRIQSIVELPPDVLWRSHSIECWQGTWRWRWIQTTSEIHRQFRMRELSQWETWTKTLPRRWFSPWRNREAKIRRWLEPLKSTDVEDHRIRIGFDSRTIWGSKDQMRVKRTRWGPKYMQLQLRKFSDPREPIIFSL